jgi:hypothetical protein
MGIKDISLGDELKSGKVKPVRRIGWLGSETSPESRVQGPKSEENKKEL